MDRNKILRVLCSVGLAAVMGAAAGGVGERELLFPEAAALAVGLWVIDKPVWRVRRWQVVALMSAGAVAGIGLTNFSPLPLPCNLALAFGFAALCLRISRTTLVPLLSASLLPVLLGTRTWVYVAAVLVLTLLLTLGQWAMECLRLRQRLFLPADGSGAHSSGTRAASNAPAGGPMSEDAGKTTNADASGKMPAYETVQRSVLGSALPCPDIAQHRNGGKAQPTSFGRSTCCSTDANGATAELLPAKHAAGDTFRWLHPEIARWLGMGIVVFLVAELADLTRCPYLILPPLVVTFVELVTSKAGFRNRPLQVFLLLLAASVLGTIGRLAAQAYALPLGLVAGCVSGGMFVLFACVGRSFAPAAALALVPLLVPGESVAWLPVQAAGGAALLMGVALLFFLRCWKWSRAQLWCCFMPAPLRRLLLRWVGGK